VKATAARLTRSGRRRHLNIAATLALGTSDRDCLTTGLRPASPTLTSSQAIPATKKRSQETRGTPGHPGRQPGHRHISALKSRSTTRCSDPPAPVTNRCE
jgi:hypothetical protein